MNKPKNPLPERFYVSRRSFLRRCVTAAAATGLPLWFVQRELGAADLKGNKSPNDRPGVALIGCGGMGGADTEAAAYWGDILAVCDVDQNHAAAAAKRFTEKGRVPDVYKDFRRLLERKDIHCIVNATPDHWHTLVNYGAVRAGKDVYGEKPLTLTIDEGRHLIKAVRENKAVLQTGTQQRSDARFRLACELVRNKRIGTLKEANVWLPAGLVEGPFSAAPVPAELDWDFWQGQAPATDYVPQRCHATFRFWYEYSGGTMTDWGAHHNDIAYWAIGQVSPSHVASERLSTPIPGGYNAYGDYVVNYTYANGIALNIRTTRDDSIYGEHLNPDGQPNGIQFVGADGTIWVNRDRIEASDPEILKAELPEDAVRLYKSKHHMGNFFDCVNSRELPICDVETGHRSANMCHLGAISLRTGKSLTWDAQSERFTGANAAEANTYLSREMRAPYDLSFVG
ncbi:Gfo/Idh/MocA family oxidoreductase [Pelagicoccus sp. SDUM812002]|uniref:Gfo/Idh/MocA family protein n=1 Tax=Pelagicoccus sp. SDUM812002 TaxID=3041266 RepID=UPI00280D41E7|nr:Gfo/Idh/MocA family oxidoreductase [Pelagicoccus sp. SDUM812002]MDQ8185157.1 Gfo/Idh/MocA family oxidoreductase [Pelagicoccus sp. SDUM812002]